MYQFLTEKAAGCNAVCAALAALCSDCPGQVVTVSATNAMMNWLQMDVGWNGGWTKKTLEKPGAIPGVPVYPKVYRLFSPKDAEKSLVVFGANDKEFAAACRALDRPDFLEDPRFSTLPGRLANIDALWNEIGLQIRKFYKNDIVASLEREEVGHAPVNSPEAAFGDKQLQFEGCCKVVREDTTGGSYRVLDPSVAFSKTVPATFRSHAPQLGQHTASVLSEAGFSASEIGQLAAARR